MSYYHPEQNPIKFVYNRQSNNVSIKSKVTVKLPAEDDLQRVRIYFDAPNTQVVKEFDIISGSFHEDHFGTDDISVEIIRSVDIPYHDNDQQGFINALKGILNPQYKVKAVVNPKPGVPSSGGQTTSTISNDADVIII
jgi:hypothetical protein